MYKDKYSYKLSNLKLVHSGLVVYGESLLEVPCLWPGVHRMSSPKSYSTILECTVAENRFLFVIRS